MSMNIGIQFFGGRGSGGGGSARGGGGGSAGSSRRSLTSEEITAEERKIDRQGFQKAGNGNWEFATDPNTGIGAQILDETGGSRDPMYGRGGKVYSVTTWGRAPGDYHTSIISGSLNDAKTAAKEEMKGRLRSTTVKP